jgi:hypothetical protein
VLLVGIRYFLRQRAAAAFLAISDLLLADKLLALALPPFKPPSRPNAAAAALTSSEGSSFLVTRPSAVAISAMRFASWFMSRGRADFFAMTQRYKNYAYPVKKKPPQEGRPLNLNPMDH